MENLSMLHKMLRIALGTIKMLGKAMSATQY
jgi:hypothetical protein